MNGASMPESVATARTLPDSRIVQAKYNLEKLGYENYTEASPLFAPKEF